MIKEGLAGRAPTYKKKASSGNIGCLHIPFEGPVLVPLGTTLTYAKTQNISPHVIESLKSI